MVLSAQRPWRRRQPPDDVVAELEHELAMAPLAARLLALRGVQGARQADAFIAKRLQDLHRPEKMRDMGVAAARLADAINQRKRILIHGDYDVDGSTATVLLKLFVRACGHDAVAWIPHRRIDGYGLGEASMQAAVEHRAELMITVDCGIADHGWARRIEGETGCAVIITDHHLPQSSLPECTAVCNPNHPKCEYPDKTLAGVGVAWKLAWATAVALCGSDRITDRLRAFLVDALALVAIGTVADCASLAGENRILVHHGLKALARTANPGLRALLDHCRLDTELPTATDVGWKLGPLLNASGRLGSAMANIELLTAPDSIHALEVLNRIVGENEERKRLTQFLTRELIARAESEPEWARRASLVFAGEGWHQGVVGIVASRLVEHFGKPSAVIAIDDAGVGKGSLRSVADVHLGDILEACRPLLLKGGGHAMAAGLSIEAARIADFSAAFERHVGARVLPGNTAPKTDYDADAAVAELDADFFASLESMAPFGIANPEPIVHLSGASFVARPRLFGANGDHVRAAITDAGGGLREFLAWRAKDRFDAFSAHGVRFDLLVRPQAGRWRGEAQQRLVFVDGRSH